jgi:hypothetical protein
MPKKIETEVPLKKYQRSDLGKRRKRPRGNSELGAGYRVNPETNMPELWCSNCEVYKHVTLFKTVSAPRSRRICRECDERLSKAAAPGYGMTEIVRKPYGGERKFGEEIWGYMKDVLAPPKGKGAKGAGRRGRPVTRLIRGKAVKRILAGSKTLPKSHPDLLRKAILDPDNRVHFKSRLWLVFRQGILDDKQLRLCACELADCIMDDVTEVTQDDIYFGLGGVVDDMRALALGKAYYSRQRLEDLRSRVAAMETTLSKREARKDYDHVARRVFFVLTALLSGSAFIALNTIAYEFFHHFSFKYDSDDAALQDMLVRVCNALETSEEDEVQEETQELHSPEDALLGTIWQEYDHHSPTRFLMVTDTHKHVVQLRVISNEDTDEEVGEYINATRNQFEGLGPGYFMQLFPEDIRDSGVPLGRINRRLRSWGLQPLPTELDDARKRLEEIESKEAETDPELGGPGDHTGD